jgi:hypothetical protein
MTNSRIWASLLEFAALAVLSTTAAAQPPSDTCKPSSVVPTFSGEQRPARVIVEPPLPGPLAARGVAIIQYCAENLRFVPVFGPAATSVSPRVGHIHVAVDDSSWVWADASGNPVILQGLSPGQHTVRIDLVDANHHQLDSRTVSFSVPQTARAEHH